MDDCWPYARRLVAQLSLNIAAPVFREDIDGAVTFSWPARGVSCIVLTRDWDRRFVVTHVRRVGPDTIATENAWTSDFQTARETLERYLASPLTNGTLHRQRRLHRPMVEGGCAIL